MAKNPAQFKLSKKEVGDRQEAVKGLRKSLADITADLASTVTKSKLDKDRREQLMMAPKKSDRVARMEEATVKKNQAFIDSNSPQVLLKKQDEELDKLTDAVKRLHHIANAISTAQDEDAVLLNELDYRVDNSLGKLKGQ